MMKQLLESNVGGFGILGCAVSAVLFCLVQFLGFILPQIFKHDGKGITEQQQQQEDHDSGRLHRMMAWNANNVNANAVDGGNSGHGA
ncbi:transmembrane protein, putative [Medicago truncatula]|uniref:Transmembrane protein, putative n=1 Tax=Medicago truncatula TaxID=3880 RepID=A0A072TKH9_MEDTR|nr:transmembrane protein, putative [Medicago truncatula]